MRILAARGYWSSPSDARRLWELYSEGMAAGWMNLDEDDDEVFSRIRYYIEGE